MFLVVYGSYFFNVTLLLFMLVQALRSHQLSNKIDKLKEDNQELHSLVAELFAKKANRRRT